MKPALSLLLFAAIILSCTTEKYEVKTAESGGYTYTYVTNDPLNVHQYTLKNGLTVYLSDYKNEPRLQTAIAVKAGGKNDPADNTGLAHYLEHMMFKGTSRAGTLDWDKEQILLDSIERMFQHYRTLTDSNERKAYYQLIDKTSNEASKLAIANEYDKMVSELGARGTNAYTTEDRTVYINDIPANQIESWLQIEGDRFRQIVNRLFHTELEAVYEEKNRSLDNDYWKTFDAINRGLFKKHQYGTQSVIGTIDHLKNPSITAIKQYFKDYYVPNNVAICLSGDLDYDKTIALIDKYFGDWQPNDQLPVWNKIQEDPRTSVEEVEVLGPFEEWVYLGYRFDGFNSAEYPLLKVTDMILSNQVAGLIDLNLKQQQKVLNAYSFVDEAGDYSRHIFVGTPREGQALEQVKGLLLEQIEQVKRGEFEDWLIPAVINDFKKNGIRGLEQNWTRSDLMVRSFALEKPWISVVSESEQMGKITKEQIMKFAQDRYQNCVAVYKRTGKDPEARKVDKPQITKVPLNCDQNSPFHKEILARTVSPLQPVFVDYEKDIQKLSLVPGVDVLYNQNKENDLFTLYYLTESGSNNDPKMPVAVNYLQYIGTDSLSAEDFKKGLYRLGCDFGVYAAPDRTYIYLSGLAENMEPATKLFETMLQTPKADEDALKKMVEGILKERDDNKKNKYAILYDGMWNYGIYGPGSPFTNVLSNSQLLALKPGDLIPVTQNFTRTEHKVLYYGPAGSDEVLAQLKKLHQLPESLQPAPPKVEFQMQDVRNQSVYWTNYDMVQAEMILVARGEPFDPSRAPESRMFNEYFGPLVFQEIREAQGLAYGVSAWYNNAGKKGQHDSFMGYVGTQADKQAESLNALVNIINNMPESPNDLEVARKSLMNKIESERITRTNLLFNYLNTEDLGLDHDIRADVYAKAPVLTMDDLKAFQKTYVKDKKYNLMVLGSKDKLDFKAMSKFGKVQELQLDELFGYEKLEKIDVEGPK